MHYYSCAAYMLMGKRVLLEIYWPPQLLAPPHHLEIWVVTNEKKDYGVTKKDQFKLIINDILNCNSNHWFYSLRKKIKSPILFYFIAWRSTSYFSCSCHECLASCKYVPSIQLSTTIPCQTLSIIHSSRRVLFLHLHIGVVDLWPFFSPSRNILGAKGLTNKPIGPQSWHR